MVCKHWQQAHDGLIRALVLRTLLMPTTTASWQRFKGVTSLDVLRANHVHDYTNHVGRGYEVTVARLLSMASVLPSLSSLDLRTNKVTDAGVMALATLTALTSHALSWRAAWRRRRRKQWR
eukprot:1160924-Pyramimonas_sp.AAC.1